MCGKNTAHILYLMYYYCIYAVSVSNGDLWLLKSSWSLVLVLSVRWGVGGGGAESPPPPGVGAGDALWVQLCAPAASAAPCWQTDHSGAGPPHCRAGGGNHSGVWLQTLPGTHRVDQLLQFITFKYMCPGNIVDNYFLFKPHFHQMVKTLFKLGFILVTFPYNI